LTDFPHIGSIRSEIYPGLRVISAAGKAVICFTVDDETTAVDVICITYGGADWQARIRERR
jgi:plasmid stabilization system protein ParE